MASRDLAQRWGTARGGGGGRGREGAPGEIHRQNRGIDGARTDVTEVPTRPDRTSGAPAAASPPPPPAATPTRHTADLGHRRDGALGTQTAAEGDGGHGGEGVAKVRGVEEIVRAFLRYARRGP